MKIAILYGSPEQLSEDHVSVQLLIGHPQYFVRMEVLELPPEIVAGTYEDAKAFAVKPMDGETFLNFVELP